MRKKFWDVLSPFVFTFLALILVSAISLLAASVFAGVDVTAVYMLYQTALEIVISCIYFALMIWQQRKNYQVDCMRFPIEKENVSGMQMVLPAGCGLAVLIAINAALKFAGISGYTNVSDTADLSSVPVFLLLILETVVLAPIAEEMIFRGMIYRRIKYYLSVPAAVVLSAALFGVYHMSLVQGCYAFAAGVIFAVVYEKTGSLRTVVIMHALHNALVLVFLTA